jgi:hypothetical protein
MNNNFNKCQSKLKQNPTRRDEHRTSFNHNKYTLPEAAARRKAQQTDRQTDRQTGGETEGDRETPSEFLRLSLVAASPGGGGGGGGSSVGRGGGGDGEQGMNAGYVFSRVLRVEAELEACAKVCVPHTHTSSSLPSSSASLSVDVASQPARSRVPYILSLSHT